MHQVQYNLEEIEELSSQLFSLQDIADYYDVPFQRIRHKFEKDELFQEAVLKGRKKLYEKCKDILFSQAMKGNIKALIFILENLHNEERVGKLFSIKNAFT